MLEVCGVGVLDCPIEKGGAVPLLAVVLVLPVTLLVILLSVPGGHILAMIWRGSVAWPGWNTGLMRGIDPLGGTTGCHCSLPCNCCSGGLMR